MPRSAIPAIAVLAFGLPAVAQVVDVRQGTNISVAVDPTGETLLVDLLGGLWRLPSTGGGATMLTAPGSGISQPRFDSSGERVVVERREGQQWDLWLLELASGSWRRLTDTPHSERHPDFLPDGSGVVFASDRTGRYELWLLDLRDDALRQLTDEPGSSEFPSVGSDGTIAYVHHRSEQSSLRILGRGPVGQTLLTSRAIIDSPSWRPASRVLVYNTRAQQRSDLELMIDADIDVRRSLTDGEDVFVGRVAWLGPEAFVYAADGQLWRRAVASPNRRPVHMFAGVTVARHDAPSFRFQLDDAGPHRVQGIRDLVRSTDGRMALFAALGDLWLARGRSVERLTADAHVDVEPRFVVGRDEIVFVSDREGGFELWRLSLDTGELGRLTHEAGDVSQPLPAADGAAVYFLSSIRDDGRVSSTLKRIRLADDGAIETIAGPFAETVGLSGRGGRLALSGAGIAPATAAAVAEQAVGVVNLPDPAERTAALERFDELTWSPQTSGQPFVVQAGRLFDGIRNDYRHHVDIHVAGQRIVAIVGRNRRPLPERVIDFSDMTVVPGFIDVHAHHSRNSGREIGLTWLAHGVTTVREVDADIPAALERSEAWASGARPGPRLYISPSTEELETTALAAGPIAVARAAGLSSGFAHALDARGASSSGEPPADAFRQPWSGAEIALSPLNTTYQDTLAILAGRGSYLTTGLSAALERLGGRQDPGLTGRQLGTVLERTQRSFGRVAVGSDAPLVPYGYGFHLELQTLARAGIPNAQVLRWATAGGAMALGLDGQLGSLEAGRLADFVVIDGDPLRRMGDTLNIEAVVKGGVFLTDPAEGRIVRPTGID